MYGFNSGRRSEPSFPGMPRYRERACPSGRGREAFALAPGGKGRVGFNPEPSRSVKEPGHQAIQAEVSLRALARPE